MLDLLVPILIGIALVCGALSGRLEAVGISVGESSRLSVEIALGLLASMTVWLGLVRVLQAGGLMALVTRAVRPLVRRLFPDVPPGHPAMGLMILNFASNVAGLENAATPFGVKAMKELERLNARPGVATDAMVLFVAINTANVMLFPGPVIALRAALGSTSPGSIVLPTLLATFVSTAAAVAAAKLLAPYFPAREPRGASGPEADPVSIEPPLPDSTEDSDAFVATPPTRVRRSVALALAAAIAASFGIAFWARVHGLFGGSGGWGTALRAATGDWLLPLIIGAVVVWGLGRGVAVFDKAVEGGREAFDVVLRIFPYLVFILLATGMLRASGAFDLLLRGVAPVAALLHIPAEAIPMGLMRSLSGSGARGFAVELMKQHGPDSFIGQVVSVIQGSTETTFYVMAVYFGAVRVRVARHALLACLIADAVGVLASVWACRLIL